MASATSSGNVSNTVKVSKPVSKLLRKDAALLDLFGELMDCHCSINRNSIESCNILVTQGDPRTVADAIHKVVDEIDVTANENEEEVLKILNSLKQRFPSQFETEFERSISTFKTAFHRKISGEVAPNIMSLAKRNCRIPLTKHQINYLQCHLEDLLEEVYLAWPESDVSINVQKEGKGQGALLVSSKRLDFQGVESFVNIFIEKIKISSKELESSRALFLSSTKGQKKVRQLEKKHHCLISIILPGHQMLVRAESPKGHCVFLCEGNMAATDCNVLLLPFSENQRDWTATQSLVLDRGFLSTKTNLYAKLVGSPPKQRTLTLQCPRPEVGETVKLVHVSDLPTDHSLMTEGLAEALRIPDANGKVIAVPVAMSTRQSLGENLKCILPVIQEHFSMKELPTTVVLYLERLPSSEKLKLVETLEKTINQDWKISTDSVALYEDNYPSSPRLVAVGQMTDVETALNKLQSIDVPSVFQERLSFLDTTNKPEPASRDLKDIPTDRTKWCRVEEYHRSESSVSVEVKKEDDIERADGTRTVCVDGLTEDDRELCQLYFQNSKRSGGGTQTSVVWDEMAHHWLITFEQREVAARVASKQHTVNGQPIEAKLYVPPASLPSRLMFHNVPEGTSRDCLTLYLENIAEQEVTDLIYGDNDGDVLAVFDEEPDFLQIQEMCQQKKLEGQELWVSRVPVSYCILLENISETTSKDTVTYYFSNKRRGGGPVDKVVFQREQRKCLVFFKNHEVIENILRKPHTLDGRKLQIRQYFECLGPSGGRRNPNTFTLPKTLEFIDMDKYKTFFIQQSTTLQERLVQQLTSLYAKPMFSDRKLSVECTLKSSVEDVRVLARTWTSDVQGAVSSILNMIVVLRQEVTQEMWNETKNVVASIKPASKESAVIITLTEEKAFIVVGVKSMADDLMKQVKQSISQKEEEIKRKKLEFTETVRNLKSFQLRLLAAMSFQTEATKRHPGLKVDICTTTGEISYQGMSRDVKEAQVQMFELLQSVKSDKLTNTSSLQKTLLACKETQEYVVQKFKARKTVAIWDLDTSGEVSVYSFSDSNLANAIQIIKKSVIEHQRPLEPEAAELLTTSDWTQFIRKLTDSYPGLLKIEAFPNGHLYITGTDNIMQTVLKDVELFLEENTLLTMTCHFSPSRQLFVAKYLHYKLCAYGSSLSEYKVDMGLVKSGQEFYIRGSQIGLKLMREKLEKLGSQVKCHMELLTDQAKVDFLSSPRCAKHLEKIGCRVGCVFSLKEEPENLTVVQSMSSQRVISEVNQETKPYPERRNDFSKSADQSHCNQEGKLFVYGEDDENIQAALIHLEDLVYGMLKRTLHRKHWDDRTQDLTEYEMRRSVSAVDIPSEIASDDASTVKQESNPLPKPKLRHSQSHSTHGDRSRRRTVDRKDWSIIEEAVDTGMKNLGHQPQLRRSVSTMDIPSDGASTVNQEPKSLSKPKHQNLKEIPLPRKWQPMNGDRVKLIDIPPESVEYKQVIHFLENQPVGQIQRVQNPTLYQRYKMKEQELKTHNPPNTKKEKRLWYSTDFHNINKIIASGFKHKYCRHQGTDYGQGVCFKTSLKTCRDSWWSPHAVLALVLVGEFTQGVPSMNMPPIKPASCRLYDSLSGPDMVIIYHDDQAYPEYLVTFTNEDPDGVGNDDIVRC